MQRRAARDLPVGGLELSEPLGGAIRPGLGVLGDGDDRLLLLLGPVQEVELLEQVREAAGVEHDRDQIRMVALVA